MTRPAALMIQGTNSDAGKSVLVAGLCRLFANQGVQVHPFKPQNMSNNAAIAADGGEIGRAQALQAFAAGVRPSVHHNPILLKPESDAGSQVVVHGAVSGRLVGDRYQSRHEELLEAVLASFDTISSSADLVLVEGAGSPAETNLRRRDIANMGFATEANVPVVLAGDIDRGGVIASLVGTHTVLDDRDRSMIRGFLINKFRGEPSLFDTGLATITDHTDWPSLGVVTWHRGLSRLPAEDAVVLDERAAEGTDHSNPASSIRIVAPMLSRIANFDDLDPLRLEPSVQLTMIPPGRPLPEADVVILLGTKNTLAELDFLENQGWHHDIQTHVRRGGRVLGLCGGYQMLGTTVSDPTGIEGPARTVQGLGLLDVETTLVSDKITRTAVGSHPASGTPVVGYEIHVGRTRGPDTIRPWLRFEHDEGATSPDGLVVGAYAHGIFSSDAFRSHLLESWGGTSSDLRHHAIVDEALDAWAAHLAGCLDIDELERIAQQR